MFKHILIATDGSALSTMATRNALQLSCDVKATVTMITVMAPVSMDNAACGHAPRLRDARAGSRRVPRGSETAKVLTHSSIPVPVYR